MSLRRSARISTNSIPATPGTATPNGTTNKNSKKNPSLNNKRKSRASTSATSLPNGTSSTTKAVEPTFAVPEPPKTPQSKRRKAAQESPLKPPPFTPTPSGVGLIANASSSEEAGHPLEDLPGFKPRPAEPHATNAPLSTPGGSRVVAYSSSPIKDPSASQQEDDDASPAKKRKAKEVVPPDVGAKLHPPTSTIETLLQDACEHLCAVDPKLKALVEKHHCKMFSPEGLREVVDPFTALASGIIGQQVRGMLSCRSCC